MSEVAQQQTQHQESIAGTMEKSLSIGDGDLMKTVAIGTKKPKQQKNKNQNPNLITHTLDRSEDIIIKKRSPK